MSTFKRRRRTVPVAVLLSLAVAFVAWPQLSTGASSSSSCRTRGTTLQSNDRARVYTLNRGDIEVYACRFSATSVGQHAYLGFRNASNGVSKFRLEGYHVGYLLTGVGCSRLGCVGDLIEVKDTRRPKQQRRVIGNIYALRSDGVLAVLRSSHMGLAPTVIVWDRDGGREVASGTIRTDSLALGRSDVYWTADGAAQSARALGPARGVSSSSATNPDAITPPPPPPMAGPSRSG